MSSTKRDVFNPLVAIASGDHAGRETSLSSLMNSDIGVCPKCKKPMGKATIANDDTVFYCPADRVALPTPTVLSGC